MSELFPNGLKVAMDAAGKGPTEVAEAIGTNRQNVTRWSKGQRKLTVAWAKKIAPVVNSTPEKLLLEGDTSVPLTIRPSGPEQSDVEKVGEGWPDVGDDWMDVRGVTVGGADAGFYFGDVIDQVRRPPGIRNAKNVAALNATGDSMVPRFRPGELVYVQLREPAPGDDVVVELYPENEGDAPKAFLKEMTKTTGRKLYCKQHNPKREIEFDRGEVHRLWRVLTLRDLLG